MKKTTATIGIIGAGAIGLSIAYQLAKTRQNSESILVLETNLPGAASWAGAGILPPPITKPSRDPLENLQKLSLSSIAQWSHDLFQQTGIDNEYRPCGGYYLALTPGEQAALIGLQDFWNEAGIENDSVDQTTWKTREPWLSNCLEWDHCRRIMSVPTESQLRNPRHLRALRTANEKLGVMFQSLPAEEAAELRLNATQPTIVQGHQRLWECEQWIVATGSWTSQLLTRWFGQDSGLTAVYPIKGEMLLFKTPALLFNKIINVGTRYFVPRLDGHVLVGSTEQEVGFEATPSEWGKLQLFDFVRQVIPALTEFPLVHHWAGLRPASFDQTPLIGPIPQVPNLIVATGHFRSGLQWSIGTAICVAALVRNELPPIDLRNFQPKR